MSCNIRGTLAISVSVVQGLLIHTNRVHVHTISLLYQYDLVNVVLLTFNTPVL